MSIRVRFAKASDLQQYTLLLHITYTDRYVDDSIGLTPECFSLYVFETRDTQDYLKSRLKCDDSQKTWLAFDGIQLVGSITLIDNGAECELTAFYVLPDYQGKGIGKKLYDLALRESHGKDITLDIYAHNKESIEMYKRWGFIVDTDRGTFTRHWPEWPDDVKAESIYMRLKQTK